MLAYNSKTSRALPAPTVKHVGASTALQAVPETHPVLDLVASLKGFLEKKRVCNI